MPNPFSYVELSSKDLERAKSFYKSLFSWKLESYPKLTRIHVGEGTGGGMQAWRKAPTTWLPYVEVKSVKKTLAKAKAGGATITLDYKELGGIGAVGIFIDPTGAMLGVHETFALNGKAKKLAKAPKKAIKTKR